MIYNKDYYYESCLRNGFILPPKRSPFVSVTYLHNVVMGRYYCPKVGQVLRLTHPSVPTKERVLQEVNNLLPRGRTIGDTTKCIPPA